MNTTEKKNYRNAFRVALLLNLALLAGLAWLWWRSHNHESAAAENNKVATAPAKDVSAPPSISTPRATEPPVVPVELTPQRMQSIGLKLGTVELKPVQSELRVTGTVDADDRRIAYVQTRFSGWLRQVYAGATYQYIRKGQPLFTIYSPDLVTTEREYLLAKQNLQSVQTSTVSGVALGAQSLLSAARERLAQWEVPASEIEKLDSTGKVITELTFNSPVSGYITEKNALPNMYVQPETRLYTVADLSVVWVHAQVFQNDLGKIKPGDPAEITVDAYPGAIFRARVESILPQVDPATRTARVRLTLSNAGLKLRPGMYVNVLLKSLLGRQLVVPASAIFYSGARQLVFVSTGDGKLEPREVQTGPQVGEQMVILKGLRAGEIIATSANFLIDSESQIKAATAAFTPPPPGAGAAAAMNGPAVNVELTSEPSPARKGNNVFRVKLTDNNGAPLSGVQVSINFYMPAMPSMGMSALTTRIICLEKSGGLYEGSGDLGAGGTWQVTVVAQQNGRTIASKQMTLSASGGV